MSDRTYPEWTWYGHNPEHTQYTCSGYPPDPTCVECDAELPDYDPDSPQLCDECRHELDEIKRDDDARKLWNKTHGFPEDGSGR